MEKINLTKLRQKVEVLRALKRKPVVKTVKGSPNPAVSQEHFFSKVPQELRRSDCDPLEKSVWITLHGWCKDKNLENFPPSSVSLGTICSEVHRGETLVRKALRGLERKGWIDIERQGCHRVNCYRLYPSPRKNPRIINVSKTEGQNSKTEG